jgi:hypothetical protein
VDIGFHYIEGKPAPDSVTAVDAFAQTGGECLVGTAFFTPKTASGDLGPGHLVVIDNVLSVGTLSARSTLDPMGTSTSMLATDQGDGKYRLGLSNSEPSAYSADVFVDGDGPFSVNFNCP